MYQVSIYNANSGKYLGVVRKGLTAEKALEIARHLTQFNYSGTAVYIAEKARK